MENKAEKAMMKKMRNMAHELSAMCDAMMADEDY